MTGTRPMDLGTPFQRVVLVLAGDSARSPCAEEHEMGRLIETLEGHVVGVVVQRLDRPNPKTLLGPGKVQQLAELCAQTGADTVVVDAPLAPSQITNLEDSTGAHVMDRREVILEIFARRAKTAEAKIQVELAYLDFVHPRMQRAAGKHREYRGGVHGAGASIVQQRLSMARQRRASLRRQLEHIQIRQTERSKGRQALPTVALVGYTNAGKSSLLRALARDDVYVDDLLFATLDTTTRRVFLPSRRIALFSDTVGFIRDLPHELVACFHSTLQEALNAKLLVHVVDASAADFRAQMCTVDRTLDELNATHQPRIVALNKIDRLDAETARETLCSCPGSLGISAVTGHGLERLLVCIDQELHRVEEASRCAVPVERAMRKDGEDGAATQASP